MNFQRLDFNIRLILLFFNRLLKFDDPPWTPSHPLPKHNLLTDFFLSPLPKISMLPNLLKLFFFQLLSNVDPLPLHAAFYSSLLPFNRENHIQSLLLRFLHKPHFFSIINNTPNSFLKLSLFYPILYTPIFLFSPAVFPLTTTRRGSQPLLYHILNIIVKMALSIVLIHMFLSLYLWWSYFRWCLFVTIKLR